ncbi:cysteine hydrolase family protein [Planctomyces sp. SH-PL14]|uniref:cysteine hydrolase family protein n=1 Tax=Planctomyces sp. SH-PL14 TaxID=1632864 RepID=UPI00078ED9C2|nr:isochorismatase family cysteine hydrolase [Planctomyces sp. SH-PL14]AMV19586.1 Vibriobactin-specific isochorismatase [Planctomyces sp. SH-PL14]
MTPSRNPDLHGSAPDKSDVVLLLIDVINDFNFPEGDQLLLHAMSMAPHLSALKAEAKQLRIPVVYVNDNFGRWRSDFRHIVEHCTRPEAAGRRFVEQLRPADDDYFILKPKHSGFFATGLEMLLAYLGTQRVILTGIAGNICVLFTANDAYMRDLGLVVPRNCVASNTQAENDFALCQMGGILKANTSESTALDLAATGSRASGNES